jgi:trk system potassium uptake protein TrkA
VNAVVAHVARTVFEVPAVVSRNYDPRWRALHEAMGLPMVSSTAWGAQRVQELLEGGGLRPVLSAGNGEVEVYELAVPDLWRGRTLAELVAGVECAPVSLTRGGRATLPQPSALLEADDVLQVGASVGAAALLRRRLFGEGA